LSSGNTAIERIAVPVAPAFEVLERIFDTINTAPATKAKQAKATIQLLREPAG